MGDLGGAVCYAWRAFWTHATTRTLYPPWMPCSPAGPAGPWGPIVPQETGVSLGLHWPGPVTTDNCPFLPTHPLITWAKQELAVIKNTVQSIKTIKIVLFIVFLLRLTGKLWDYLTTRLSVGLGVNLWTLLKLFSVCLCTVLPKTSLVNKDFFNHLYSSHPTLPVCASSSFLRPWGSLIELVKKNQGPFLADPVETCACRTYYALKALLELRRDRLCRESTTMWYVPI